jgi:hypothetical protein
VIGHTAIFGQRFTVLQYGGPGGEIIFSLDHNEHTGTVHILATLRWLQAHKYVPAHAKVAQADFGWEICSTGGTGRRSRSAATRCGRSAARTSAAEHGKHPLYQALTKMARCGGH